MACRKAAYRAGIQLSEWMEKQQEEADKRLVQLEAEIRKTWTPTEILDTCCMPWLKDGPEILGFQGRGDKGCNGVCGKAHPRITLDFQDNEGSIATISHELTPMVEYFNNLCEQGKAKEKVANKKELYQPKQYLLEGFLNTHHAGLKKSNLPNHLIKVSPTALAASQRAHQRQVETEEAKRDAKRQKVQGEAVVDKSLEILEDVLQVCWEHGSLLDHLDLAEIAWMRLTCKTMAKFAARLACARLRELPLSYTYMENHDRGPIAHEKRHDRMQLARMNEDGNNKDNGNTPPAEQGDPPLTKNSNTAALALLHPVTPRSFNWESICDHPEIEHAFRIEVMVAVEPARHSKRILPERQYLCSKQDHLDIMHCSFDPRGLQGDHVFPGGRISCKVSTDSHHAVSDGGFTSNGTFALHSVKMDFQDLLGIYARKKLPIAREEFHRLRTKRPATRAEKEYVKGLAKESRLASFQVNVSGMKGW